MEQQPDLDAAERDVDDIERALHRLDEGTHGACEVCGAPIAADVLAESPTTRTCAEHRA
jgi:RNA polymerase-binding transcription factor DksA